MELFDTLHYWHWWVIAVVLVILELTVSGAFFFLWLATAAAVTGLVALVVPSMAWEGQLFIFALLTVFSVFMWRRFKPGQTESDMPGLNKRGHQYIGRHFTLDHPIVNGVGTLIVSDTTWKITGDDMPAGTKVTVTRVEGTSLHVEAVA